jgi:hypothetical protein
MNMDFYQPFGIQNVNYLPHLSEEPTSEPKKRKYKKRIVNQIGAGCKPKTKTKSKVTPVRKGKKKQKTPTSINTLKDAAENKLSQIYALRNSKYVKKND